MKNLDSAPNADVEKFQKAQGLLALWGKKVKATPEQLKEIADSLIYFRRNNYKPEILDQEGEEGEKFKKLEHAILNWRATSAESSEISPGEVEGIAKEIECALDWWHTNCEDNDVPEFKEQEGFMDTCSLAQKKLNLLK